jgi:hypothetical protein
MKNYENINRCLLTAFSLLFAVIVSGTFFDAVAQKSGRDPFKKPVVNPKTIKSMNKPQEPVVVTPPDVKTRIEEYKKLKLQYMQQGLPAPKPTKALLLSEVEVKGIFQTPRGYAAMVEATPISLSYVIYPGEEFYDGQLVAIEEGQLICRKIVLWSDKRVEKRTEKLPLAQPNLVKDQMTTARTGGSTADVPANNGEMKSAEAAFTQMMDLLQKLLTAGQQQQSAQPQTKKPN